MRFKHWKKENWVTSLSKHTALPSNMPSCSVIRYELRWAIVYFAVAAEMAFFTTILMLQGRDDQSKSVLAGESTDHIL